MSEHPGELLSALLDGELSPDEARQAQAHVSACPACEGELRGLEAARALVRALPWIEPPEAFVDRLLWRSRSARSRRAAGVAALVASAAASLALLGMSSPPEAPVSPSVASLVEAHATGASLTGEPLSQLVPAGVPVTFRP